MEDNELILLGKILKTYGHDGHVLITLEGDFLGEIKEMELLFIVVDELMVPFFISSILNHGENSILVSFDGYESKDSMEEFVGCNIMVSHSVLKVIRSDSLPLYLKGFSLLDINGNRIGTIDEIASYPMQVMLIIRDDKNKEIMIPLNDDWIVTIDKQGMEIVMNLPDGIIAVN